MDDKQVGSVKPEVGSEGLPAPAPAPPPAPTAKPGPRSPGSDFWSQTSSLILPLIAIAVSVVVWYRTNDELADLRQSQRVLISEVAALRHNALIDLDGAQARGADTAVVTLVEFSDYECPYCIRHFQLTMPEIEANYINTGKIRYVFRDFPVDQLHPEAIRAHESAHCAAEQNRFWDLHVRLFTAPGTHTGPLLEQRATEAGLSLEPFRTCLASGRTQAAIRATAAQAVELGAGGTPAFFVGVRDRATNQMKVAQAISGAQSFSVFARVIDAVIKQTQTQ
jgi:protein-disulfide isomerase